MGGMHGILLGSDLTDPCDPSSAGLAILLTADVTCRETALEIASALAYLHSLNILHGDLSGGNILLTSSNKDNPEVHLQGASALCQYQIRQRCLRAMMLRVPDYRSKCAECRSTLLLMCPMESPDTAHLHACSCKCRVQPGMFGIFRPMPLGLLSTAPLG